MASADQSSIFSELIVSEAVTDSLVNNLIIIQLVTEIYKPECRLR